MEKTSGTSTLLLSMKNELFRFILSQGLDARHFNWTLREAVAYQKAKAAEFLDPARRKKNFNRNASWSSNKSEAPVFPCLEYADSGFYFLVGGVDNSLVWTPDELRFVEFSPGQQHSVHFEDARTWEAQKEGFGKWLSFLKRELSEPDLWSFETQVNEAVLGLPSSTPGGSEIPTPSPPPASGTRPNVTDAPPDNEPFDGQEIQDIKSALTRIGTYVRQDVDINQQQEDFLRDQLSYLKEAVTRQGRKDWIHTTVGVLATLITALSIDPGRASVIWNFIVNTVKGFAYYLPR